MKSRNAGIPCIQWISVKFHSSRIASRDIMFQWLHSLMKYQNSGLYVTSCCLLMLLNLMFIFFIGKIQNWICKKTLHDYYGLAFSFLIQLLMFFSKFQKHFVLKFKMYYVAWLVANQINTNKKYLYPSVTTLLGIQSQDLSNYLCLDTGIVVMLVWIVEFKVSCWKIRTPKRP